MPQDFATQMGEHIPRMYRVALRIVFDSDRAHDVVQDACVKALRKIDNFNGDASLASWLHRITVNCARDHMRGNHREKKKIEAFGLRVVQSPGSALSPAGAIEQREMIDMVLQQIQLLPDDCRTAFVLTQLDGYSYDQAGEIEDQPRGTVASRVFRAKQLLLKRMASGYSERKES
jgi:RNA polymerase sigma-70 factor (ECF subfamily)